MSGGVTGTDWVFAIDHVVVAVEDLGTAETAYQRLLGCRAERAESGLYADTACRVFRLANATVVLVAPRGEGTIAQRVRHHLAASGPGLMGCVFAVENAAGLAARLRAAGYAAADPAPLGAAQRMHVLLPTEATRGALVFAVERPPREPLPALPAAECAGAPRELDHIVLHTGDPDAAIGLYAAGFGLRLALDKTFPQWGARLQFFRVAGVSFEVSSRLSGAGRDASGTGDAGEPREDLPEDRFHGLCFRTDDIEAARRRLAGAGLDVSPVRDGRKPGTQVATVRSGTCGVPTLLIQHSPRPKSAGPA